MKKWTTWTPAKRKLARAFPGSLFQPLFGLFSRFTRGGRGQLYINACEHHMRGFTWCYEDQRRS